MYIPNETGSPQHITKVSNEWLLGVTQRLVDTIRRQADEATLEAAKDFCGPDISANSPGLINVFSVLAKPIEDRIPQNLRPLVAECRRRGLELDTSR